MGAILEERAREATAGTKSTFPYWLAPTQLRLIPVKEEHAPLAASIAADLPNIRVDIDDRNESIGKRVRAAEREWVPAYAVIGDNENTSGVYIVKARGKELGRLNGQQMRIDSLADELYKAQNGRPFRKSYLDQMVSRQLRFGSSY